MLGLFEPVCAPWKVEGVPDDFSFGAHHAGLGPHGPLRRDGDATRAGHDGDRDQEVLLRAGELHARPAAGRRRGARAPELLRRRRPQLDRHPHRRRPRPGAGALDHRPAGPTSTSPGSTSTASTATRPTPSTARTRTVESLGHGLPVPLPRRARCRPRAARRSPPLHDRLAAQGAYFRDVSGWEGADWYAPGRRRAVDRAADLGPAALVPVLAGRARGRPRGRDRSWTCRSCRKFLVQGRDAGRLLDHISANRRRRYGRARSPTRSGSTTPAGSRPT